MRTPTDSHHLQLKQSKSTNRCENPCTSISESLTDVGLHQELITEILVRLPVKPLLKFKCVSKSWLSLISSRQFISSHFSRSSRADQHLNSQVLFPVLTPISGIKQFSLYSALCEPSTNVSDIEYPSQKPCQHPWIAGIINGLVCLLLRNVLFLWNPVLRKSKLLPKPNVTLRGNMISECGFGYDESNDDYKVVIVTRSVYPFTSGNEFEDMVYSLLTDSWRKFENSKDWLPLDGFGKYAHGNIHWTASCSAREWKIVSLDMVSDKYGELQRPDYEAGVSGWVFEVVGGQLFVLCDYDKKKADLWVMDKYGVQESWSKVVSIPYDNVHPAKPYSLHRVVCILRNDEIVLSDGSDLLVYQSKRKEFRNIELRGCRHRILHVYVESMVSADGSGRKEVFGPPVLLKNEEICDVGVRKFSGHRC